MKQNQSFKIGWLKNNAPAEISFALFSAVKNTHSKNLTAENKRSKGFAEKIKHIEL